MTSVTSPQQTGRGEADIPGPRGGQGVRLLVLGTDADAQELRDRAAAAGLELAQRYSARVSHVAYGSGIDPENAKYTRIRDAGLAILPIQACASQLGLGEGGGGEEGAAAVAVHADADAVETVEVEAAAEAEAEVTADAGASADLGSVVETEVEEEDQGEAAAAVEAGVTVGDDGPLSFPPLRRGGGSAAEVDEVGSGAAGLVPGFDVTGVDVPGDDVSVGELDADVEDAYAPLVPVQATGMTVAEAATGTTAVDEEAGSGTADVDADEESADEAFGDGVGDRAGQENGASGSGAASIIGVRAADEAGAEGEELPLGGAVIGADPWTGGGDGSGTGVGDGDSGVGDASRGGGSSAGISSAGIGVSSSGGGSANAYIDFPADVTGVIPVVSAELEGGRDLDRDLDGDRPRPRALDLESMDAAVTEAAAAAESATGAADAAAGAAADASAAPARGATRRVLVSLAWALIPFVTFGLLSPLVFGYAALRLRSRALAATALGYTVAVVLAFVLSAARPHAATPSDATGALLTLALAAAWIGGTVHALSIRVKVFVH